MLRPLFFTVQLLVPAASRGPVTAVPEVLERAGWLGAMVSSSPTCSLAGLMLTSHRGRLFHSFCSEGKLIEFQKLLSAFDCLSNSQTLCVQELPPAPWHSPCEKHPWGNSPRAQGKNGDSEALISEIS